MIIKLMGGLFVLVSGLAASLSHRRFQMKRLSTIDGFIALLFFIKGQVDCFSKPRSEIIESLPSEIFYACNCPEGTWTLEEMIDASRIYLDVEPLRLISSFSSEFGGTFRDEQIRRCDYYISALTAERKAVSDDARTKIKARGALYICFCIGMIILMW